MALQLLGEACRSTASFERYTHYYSPLRRPLDEVNDRNQLVVDWTIS
jgi:hypothetical protein